MKAWQVMSDPDRGSTVVFAETRGQAKQLAMSTDTCEDASYLEIECRRLPAASSQSVQPMIRRPTPARSTDRRSHTRREARPLIDIEKALT